MMSRERLIKPQFFTSDDVHSLPVPARLTFIGLWLYADDYGNERLDAHLIKAAIWPRERTVSLATVEKHLDMLVQLGMLELYSVNDRDYFHIAQWKTYQRVSNPSRSSIPPFSPREDRASHARADDEWRGTEGGESDEGDESEWESEGGERAASRASDVPPSPFCKRHPNGTDQPCTACGTARLRLRKWENERASA